ncbi:hypothetical protein BC833DRAFT_587736 [Globomyces pollinis-pini]|nr:hypothetical protein BC833DRAFT_587736 [Globomyces pollinis-pini]
MPPKKAKKTKEKPPEEDSPELILQEKLLKVTIENEALQRELETKNEINGRLRLQIQDQKQRINYLELQIEMRAQDRLDLTSDMSRQYKTMQSELISEVNRLESVSYELHTKLAQLQTAFTEAKKNHEEEIQQKEANLEEQQMKMTYMTNEFENMLSETLNKITRKLDLVSNRWKENDETSLAESSSRKLEDFQLTRLALGSK